MNLLEINSWWPYFLYILKRNKGYGYRKLLNSFNILAEVSCYSWLFNGQLLKDFLVIPLFFILFSFVLDQVIFLARISPNFSIKKVRITILTIITLILLAAITLLLKDPSTKNLLLGSIFGLKLFGVSIQTMISLNVVKYYSTRRIRPRFYLYVIISVLNFIVLFPFCYSFSGLDVILITAGMFSLLKVIFEVIYYFDIKKSRDKNILIDHILAKASKHHDSNLGVIFVMLSLVAISYILSISSSQSYLVVLFLTSFLYRLTSRFYRFLWVDFLRLKNNNLLKQALITRSIFILTALGILGFVLSELAGFDFSIGLSVLFLCLLEITLLRKRKFETSDLIISFVLLVSLYFSTVPFLFNTVLIFVSIYFAKRNLQFTTLGERYTTNYFLMKMKKIKYSFSIRFYGSRLELSDFISFCDSNGYKARRVGKGKFALFEGYKKKQINFKHLLAKSFSQNIKFEPSLVDTDKSSFVRLYQIDSFSVSRNLFGFWSGNLSTPEIRMLNFYSNRVIVSYSNHSKFKSFKFMERKFSCSSPLGDKWLIN